MWKKIFTILLVVILCILIIPNNMVKGGEFKSEIISSGVCGKGYRYNVHGWIYIHIEGEPRERGYQYGYLASAEIVDMIYRWSNMAHTEAFMKIFVIKQLPQNYDELSKTYWNLCKQRGMKFFWNQYPEEYQEEIKGIAEGVRARGGTVHGHLVDYKDIFTLSVIEETRETYNNPGGIGRPFKRVFNLLKGLLQNIRSKDTKKEEDKDQGHCMAFIATGDATADGGVVASQSLIFASYMTQRTNMILDVQPSSGHRFVMTVFPGYIWSSQDFYENDCGIILMETCIWPPIGPWKVKGTIPVGVRARKAIQYSDNLDDVKQILVEGNNGLYPCDWVMGDTKTGEIASLELGLYNHAWAKKDNGFLWSASNAKDDKVRWGLWSIFGFGIIGRIIMNIMSKFAPMLTPMDTKFKELGDKYYGKIDTEIAKEIMSTEPIGSYTSDCKVTDTKLLEDLGLWVHFGRPNGSHYKPSPEDENKFKGITENPGTGWLKLYASNSQPKDLPDNDVQNSAKKNSKVIWIYQTEDPRNTDYALSTGSEDTLYVATSSSSIYALDLHRGKLIWEQPIGKNSITPTVSEGLVFIGTEIGLEAINKETGTVKWEQKVGKISSKPIVVNDVVIAGCSDGNIYAFDMDTGKVEWRYKFSESTAISEANSNTIYVGSNDICYAFDIVNKKILWEFKTNGIITASPAVNGKTVYLGSWDGNVYAIDSNTGDIKWIYETGWGIDTTPAVSDGMVFVGSLDNNFYALDVDNGDMKWFFNCLSGIHSSPVAYGEYVFFGSDDGRLYALNKETGDLGWSFTPGYSIKKDDVNNYITTPIISQPVVKDGIVYISAKGNVYALDAQTVETSSSSEKLSPKNDSLFLVLYLLLILLGIALLIRTYLKKKQ